jgi:mRNA interferase RelE/StbE
VLRSGQRANHHHRDHETSLVEKHLRHEPKKESQSRIKRLKGLSKPQYRLRIVDIRVFYDVTPSQVEVLAIVSKEGSQKWLNEQAKHE